MNEMTVPMFWFGQDNELLEVINSDWFEVSPGRWIMKDTKVTFGRDLDVDHVVVEMPFGCFAVGGFPMTVRGDDSIDLLGASYGEMERCQRVRSQEMEEERV